MLGFGSKFHMNAFPFSVHYDGNGPYHSICFALELSLVIYVFQVQMLHVTIQAMFLSWRTQGGICTEYKRFVGVRALTVWACEAVVALPVCDRRPPGWGAAPGKVTQQSGFCMVM